MTAAPKNAPKKAPKKAPNNAAATVPDRDVADIKSALASAFR